MTAAIDIINLALKDIGIIGNGQTASADDISDCLTTLNQMLGQWQADKLYVFAQEDVSTPATGGQSYTIGPGATMDTALPVKIDGAFWRDNGIDYPLIVLNSFEDWERLSPKALAGVPRFAFFQRDNPVGLVYLYPQPSTGELHVITRVQLTRYATTADKLIVPPEYELALRYSLAELIAPTFGTQLRPDVAALAAKSRRMMKRNNVRIPTLGMPEAVVDRGRYDIYRGY